MRFCDECGAQLEDDAVFCDECGAQVENVSLSGESANEVKRENTQSCGNKGGKGTKAAIVILALFLCVAVVFIFILFKYKDDNTAGDKANPNATQTALVTGNQETDAVNTKAPGTEAPSTKVPATEAPSTKKPQTKAPATEAPPTKPPKKTKYVLTSRSSYDSYGNCLEKSEYTYDGKGVLIKEKKTIEDYSNEPGIYEYKYNKQGDVSEYTRNDLEGNYLYQVYYKYEYDGDNNITRETYYGVDEEEYRGYKLEGNIEYTYDKKGNLTEKYMITSGRFLGTYTYDNVYNEEGLLVSRQSYFTDDWTYMEFDRGTSYTYDNKGRLIKEEEASNGIVLYRRNITYDKTGNVIKESIYNGVTEEQSTVEYKYKAIEIE